MRRVREKGGEEVSTNFYAHWRPPGSDHVSIGLHVGKSSGPSGRPGGGLAWTLDGQVFRRWAAWKEFLRDNSERIVLEDETDREWGVEQFIEYVETSSTPESRSTHYWWVTTHYPTRGHDRDWLDEDGFSFYGGEFS